MDEGTLKYRKSDGEYPVHTFIYKIGDSTKYISVDTSDGSMIGTGSVSTNLDALFSVILDEEGKPYIVSNSTTVSDFKGKTFRVPTYSTAVSSFDQTLKYKIGDDVKTVTVPIKKVLFYPTNGDKSFTKYFVDDGTLVNGEGYVTAKDHTPFDKPTTKTFADLVVSQVSGVEFISASNESGDSMYTPDSIWRPDGVTFRYSGVAITNVFFNLAQLVLVMTSFEKKVVTYNITAGETSNVAKVMVGKITHDDVGYYFLVPEGDTTEDSNLVSYSTTVSFGDISFNSNTKKVKSVEKRLESYSSNELVTTFYPLPEIEGFTKPTIITIISGIYDGRSNPVVSYDYDKIPTTSYALYIGGAVLVIGIAIGVAVYFV